MRAWLSGLSHLVLRPAGYKPAGPLQGAQRPSGPGVPLGLTQPYVPSAFRPTAQRHTDRTSYTVSRAGSHCLWYGWHKSYRFLMNSPVWVLYFVALRKHYLVKCKHIKCAKFSSLYFVTTLSPHMLIASEGGLARASHPESQRGQGLCYYVYFIDEIWD
jgi:hypothetical protein